MFAGWTAIRESWARIFENTRMIKFFITNTKVKAFENMAIVVCLENIDTVTDTQNTIKIGVIAANIFEQQNVKNNYYNNEWLMIHHHGSVVANYIPPNISVRVFVISMKQENNRLMIHSTKYITIAHMKPQVKHPALNSGSHNQIG
jgi:SnoaL-like protein